MTSQKMDVFPAISFTPAKNLCNPFPKLIKLVLDHNVLHFASYLDAHLICQKKKKGQKFSSWMPALKPFHESNYKRELEIWKWTSHLLESCALENVPESVERRMLGLKYGDNCFLVESAFTFGQRTVQPGTVHVIQTSHVPLLFFFVHDKPCHLTVRDGFFDSRDEPKYSKRRLREHEKYRILPGTVYILLTFHMCLFSLHVLDAKTELPFRCLEPIRGEPHVPTDSPVDEPPEMPQAGMQPKTVQLEPVQCCEISSSVSGGRRKRSAKYR